MLIPVSLVTERKAVCLHTASDTSSSQFSPPCTKGRRDFKLHRYFGMLRSLLNWNGFHWQAEVGWRTKHLAWQCQDVAILLFWKGGHSKLTHTISPWWPGWSCLLWLFSLVSAERHSNAWLDLPDIDAWLSYDPCTVVALCGKILHHGVDPNWTGERLCIAHFIRDNVHNRLKLEWPPWVLHNSYLSFMDNGFCIRQSVAIDN